MSTPTLWQDGKRPHRMAIDDAPRLHCFVDAYDMYVACAQFPVDYVGLLRVCRSTGIGSRTLPANNGIRFGYRVEAAQSRNFSTRALICLPNYQLGWAGLNVGAVRKRRPRYCCG